MNDWFDHILFNLRATPARPAVVLEDRTVTGEMMVAAIDRCARRLMSLPIPDRLPVAIHINNPIRHIALCLALYRIGRPSLSLADGLADTARPHFGYALCAAETAAEHHGFPHAAVTDDWFGSDAPQDQPLPQPFTRADQVCRIGLTSGTTGTPKRVDYTVAETGRRIFEKIFPAGMVDSRERVLSMPGLSVNYGFTSAMAALAAGRTLCQAATPDQALRMIELYGIDFVLLSTEQLLALTRLARITSAGFRSLRTVVVGGSVASRGLLEAAMTHVCKDIRCRYGASEAGMMAAASATQLIAQPGLAGYVVPGVEIAITDRSGQRLPAGQPGRIRMRTNANAGASGTGTTAATPEAGWTDLGDSGWVATDGRLYVCGRDIESDQAMQAALLAVEAEHAVLLGSTIGGAAAVATKGPAGGKPELLIAVVNRGGISDTALAAVIRRQGLDNRLHFFDLPSVPVGVNGKVDRDRLRRMLESRLGAGAC